MSEMRLVYQLLEIYWRHETNYLHGVSKSLSRLCFNIVVFFALMNEHSTSNAVK